MAKFTPKQNVLMQFPKAILWHWADGYCIYRHRTENPDGALGESGQKTPALAWRSAAAAIASQSDRGA